MSSYSALFDLIGALARRRYQAAERSFAALGLNHSEARLLTLLDKDGGEASQDALSKQLLIDRSNAGRALKHLEREGHLVRRSNDSDKRTNVVRITAKGRQTVVELAKLRKKMAESFFGGMSRDEAAAAVELLGKAFEE